MAVPVKFCEGATVFNVGYMTASMKKGFCRPTRLSFVIVYEQ